MRTPGETIRIVSLSLAGDLGDVRIQWYSDDLFRVATFLPGVYVAFPGDTPKVEPEQCEWCNSIENCAGIFDRYVAEAALIGWRPA